MNEAHSRSSAAWSQIGFGWRGSVAAMPLPRCVLEPGARPTAAARIVAPSAAVWPRATTTPARDRLGG